MSRNLVVLALLGWAGLCLLAGPTLIMSYEQCRQITVFCAR